MEKTSRQEKNATKRSCRNSTNYLELIVCDLELCAKLSHRFESKKLWNPLLADDFHFIENGGLVHDPSSVIR
jgi:hypothetical protein